MFVMKTRPSILKQNNWLITKKPWTWAALRNSKSLDSMYSHRSHLGMNVGPREFYCGRTWENKYIPERKEYKQTVLAGNQKGSHDSRKVLEMFSRRSCQSKKLIFINSLLQFWRGFVWDASPELQGTEFSKPEAWSSSCGEQGARVKYIMSA